MANEIMISAVSGLQPMVQLYNGSIPLGAPFAASSIGTTGEYVASVPNGIPYGRYLVLVYVGTDVKIGSGELLWQSEAEWLDALAKLEGLDSSAPMTVTPTSRKTGAIDLAITGDGEASTTVTSQT